jgi:transcriptional regulator with XRE-family HTH domain
MLIQSKKLRKLRDSKRLSQQEIADKMGISQSLYCDWEKQDSELKLENVLKLSEIFEVELDEIAPESSTFKIFNNNNHKSQNHSVIGYEVSVDGEMLFKELIKSYKAQILLLEKRNKELEAQILKLQ